jgi:hypothetical protein
MTSSLSIILESDIIKKFVRQFYAILSCIQTMMILIFGEWCKNAVQAAHVYSQTYPNRPISNSNVFVKR